MIWSSARSDEILREHDRIRKDLEAVGITADFQYRPDWPAFARAMAERKLPMFLYAWSADVPDPDNFLSKLFHSPSPRNSPATRIRRWTRCSSGPRARRTRRGAWSSTGGPSR